MPVQHVTVTESEAGQKLLQFLERRVGKSVPRSAIQRWIRKGEVRVDKGRRKPFDRVEAGQVVRIPPYVSDDAVQTSKPTGKLTIIQATSDLLVISKPAGVPAHGGSGHDDSVAARLLDMEPDSTFAPTLAHRLDRDTSGVLLAARTYAKLRELNEAFAKRDVQKYYLAWVEGSWPDSDPVTVRDHMEKRRGDGCEKVETGKGRIAEAIVTPLAVRRERSLLLIQLKTGRTHQIRVQLSSRQHPIVGDRKYGARTGKRMLLHCWFIEFDGDKYQAAPPWSGDYAIHRKEQERALDIMG